MNLPIEEKMYRKPRKPIFWKMLKEIERIKMEFAQESSQSDLVVTFADRLNPI